MKIICLGLGSVCYRLTNELYYWILNLLSNANMGVNLFPAKIRFVKKRGVYYTDII